MRNPIIILGAGGFARELYCWAIQSGFSLLAFYDELAVNPRALYKLPVISDLRGYEGCEFLVGVGDPNLKAAMALRAKGAGLKVAPPMIHPSSCIGTNVMLGEGSIICPRVVLTADIQIGEGVLINLSSTVGHDCRIGEFATLAPGVNLSGRTLVGDRAYLGTNSATKEGVEIGAGAVVGMGAVVLKHVDEEAVVVGNPARHKLLKPVS